MGEREGEGEREGGGRGREWDERDRERDKLDSNYTMLIYLYDYDYANVLDTYPMPRSTQPKVQLLATSLYSHQPLTIAFSGFFWKRSM